MKSKSINILIVFSLISFASCSQKSTSKCGSSKIEMPDKAEIKEIKTHNFGGWYCPDNIKGFPAVDIANWKSVPVVNGRMATKDETQTETSLIFVDPKVYPNAKVLDIFMPKLAYFYNESSKKNELVIVIQAINVANDSIVGFRYLNGGNGSVKLNKVEFLLEDEIEKIPLTNFVSFELPIKSNQDLIWEVLTELESTKILQKEFDLDNKLGNEWRKTSNVNYHYSGIDNPTALYASKLFGNFYVQNDYKDYTEKFFVFENNETKISKLIITCGPFGNDFEKQKVILNNWAQKVKELSEFKSALWLDYRNLDK